MSTSTRSDESQPLFEVIRTPTAASGDQASTTGNRYLEFPDVSHGVVPHDLCSPTSMNASTASQGCGMSTTKKKRPPSLFASTTAPPSGAMTSGSFALRTPLQSHCDPIARTQQQQQQQQHALPSSMISPKVTSLMTSPKVPTRNCGAHAVALSADRRTLFVGEYRVTKEGCTTLRNHLLLNPRGAGHLRLPDPSATPPLRSTLLEEPVSPISYSLDPLPLLPPAASGNAPAIVAAAASMPSPPSERLASLSPPLRFTLAERPPPLSSEVPTSNPISPELGSSSSNEFSPASVRKYVSAIHPQYAQHQHQQQHPHGYQSSQFLPPPQQKLLGQLGALYTTPQSFGNMSFSSPFHTGGGQPLRYQDLVISNVPFESGASASVYVAHHVQRTNKRFAVKRIQLGSLFPELHDGPHALLNAPSINGSFAGGCQSLGLATTSGETFTTGSPLDPTPVVAQGANPSLSPSELTPQHSASTGGAHQFAVSALPRHRQLHSILLRELRMLHSEYRSAHVVKVYNAFFIPETTSLDIVMEFMEFGSLEMLGRQLSSSDFGLADEQQSKTSSSYGATASPGSCSTSSSNSARSSISGNEERNDDECNDERVAFQPPGDVNTSQSSQDLKSRLDEQQRLKVPLPERVLAVIAEQLLRGISDMHSRGHIHRDIKPQNVLVNRHGVVKLSDFGLLETVVTDSGTTPHSTVMMDDPYAPLCSGTDKYMSPERHRGEPHGKPSDIWAFGVTLAECALGRYPASLESSVDQFERMDRMRKICFKDAIAETILLRNSVSVLSPPGTGSDEGGMMVSSSMSAYAGDVQREGGGSLPQTQSPGNEADLATLGNLSTSCMDFIQLCLAEDPAQRPTASELLESHPFLSQWKDTFDFAACIARIRRRESSRRGHRSRPKRRREAKLTELQEGKPQGRLSENEATCNALNSTCTPTSSRPQTFDVDGLKALEEATAKMVS